MTIGNEMTQIFIDLTLCVSYSYKFRLAMHSNCIFCSELYSAFRMRQFSMWFNLAVISLPSAAISFVLRMMSSFKNLYLDFQYTSTMCLLWIARALSSFLKQSEPWYSFKYYLYSLPGEPSSSNLSRRARSSLQFFMLYVKLVILFLKCMFPYRWITWHTLSKLSQHCINYIYCKSLMGRWEEGEGAVYTAIIWLRRTYMRSAMLASRYFFGRIFSWNYNSWMCIWLRFIFNFNRFLNLSSLTSYSLVFKEKVFKGFDGWLPILGRLGELAAEREGSERECDLRGE